MDQDQWKRLDSLLQSVLQRPIEERDAFLRQVCAGNESLERQVRALLNAEAPAKNFLERPALQGAALSLARDEKDDTEGHDDSLIGRTISHYRVVEKLGGGGMGVVYKAEDVRLHRFVALKFVTDELALDREALGRFDREARTASALNHPNICTIHDVGAQDGRAFIAMEYLDGSTLKERIAGHQGLELETAVTLGIEIADALDAAHTAGVIHRDIKPANIFISSRGHAKVLDFGLAKMQSRIAPDAEAATLSSTATQGGMVLGTAAYMAPEQARGGVVDHRADIWALGLVLYEMVTGTRPIAAVRLRVEKSPELERIIAKCLEVDPELRCQHAWEIRDDLQRLQKDGGSTAAATSVSTAVTSRTAGRWKILVPAVLAVLALSVIAYSSRTTPALTDKDTIVLADFDNRTGDAVFDGTLRRGLAVQLEQSPFLSLVSDERIQGELRLMGQQADAKLTPQLARDVCERTASAAVLEGSVASLGTQYVLGLRARNCRTGAVLGEQQVQTARKEDVLDALSRVASTFRTQVGESLATIQKHDTPLQEATTPSLDALRAYSLARRIHASSGPAALPLFKRAAEIDPSFAMAHALLAATYSELGQSDLSADSTATAYRLRDRTSDRENFFITASYDMHVTGNLEKAQQTCELWARTYPRDWEPHGFLTGIILPVLGKYERVVEEGHKTIDLNPEFVIGYNTLAYGYAQLDRPLESEKVLQRAEARKLEFAGFGLLRYDLAFLRGDLAEMSRLAAVVRATSEGEDWIANHEAFALAHSGRMQQAKGKSTRAADFAQQAGRPERAALFETAAALWDAFFGNVQEARRGAMAALELSNQRDIRYGAALALAISGESSQSARLADDLERSLPEDTAVRFSYLPTLRGRLSLNQRDPARAVQLLERATVNELGVPPSSFVGFFGALYPVYVRGEAYLAAHRGADAAAQFQTILDHRGIVVSDPIGALAQLQLGRALDMSGDKPKAKAAYQDFLTLWKDADSNIPILAQAKAEYARLQ